MGSWNNGIWSNLQYSSGRANGSLSDGWKPIIRRDQGSQLNYNINRPMGQLQWIATRLAIMKAMEVINSALPLYKQKLINDRIELRNERLAAIAEENKRIVTERQLKREIGKTPDGVYTAYIKRGGRIADDAMLLYYAPQETGSVMVEQIDGTTKPSKYICFIDTSAKISVNSDKNIILTQLQGRDYSRKELVSGGDLMFSISGNIESAVDNDFPTLEVAKFINIMQWGGVLSINHYITHALKVDKLIVRSYSLPAPTTKNLQPYTINCVAVEPDETIAVNYDTLGTINSQLADTSTLPAWQSLILNDQFTKIIQGGVASSVLSTASNTNVANLIF